MNIGLREKNAQSSASQGSEEQTQNNSKDKVRKDNSTKSKLRSIQRCPKCRCINPPDAKYCQQCGKVFRTN